MISLWNQTCKRLNKSLFVEAEHLLYLFLFLDVFLLLSANRVLICLRSFLVSLGLNQHSLEYFHSLSHPSVQRSLNGMEMVVQVLSEANQEGQRLVKVRVHMVREESYITSGLQEKKSGTERDHTVRVLGL